MLVDTEKNIRALLIKAENSHGEYEERELNGVYDQNWPVWYANFIVNNGLGKLLEKEITATELSRFLADSFEEYKRDNKGQNWEDYTAREIIEKL